MTIARKDYSCIICEDPIPKGSEYSKYDSPPWEGEKVYEVNPTWDHYRTHKECIGILNDFLGDDIEDGYTDADIQEARRNAEIALFDNEFGKLHSWEELRIAYKNRPMNLAKEVC